MKAIVCEMCGSQALVKKDGVYVCQNCGTKYDPEEAKKLMVEVSGSVKVDNTETIDNLRELAERSYNEGNYKDAEDYYRQLSVASPKDWRAHFYRMMSSQQQRAVFEIPLICEDILSNLRTTIQLIDSAEDVLAFPELHGDEAHTAEVCTQICVFAKSMAQADIKILPSECQKRTYFTTDFKKHMRAICDMYLIVLDYWRTKDTQKNCSKAIAIWYDNCIMINNYTRGGFSNNAGYDVLTDEEKETIRSNIRALDPDYEIRTDAPLSAGKGCYVATAIYGSYDCPQVWTLRRYRDYTLAETWYGRAFIRTYYAISPTLVKWFGETAWFKNMWKPKLDRMVKGLNENGVADTPYQDRNW